MQDRTAATQRRVLPNCCEDWILRYGGYYDPGVSFVCLECGTGWTKAGAGRYQQAGTDTVYRETERRGYRYLAPESGPSPATERCCTEIILTYGPFMQVSEVTCPVCGTPWTKSTDPGWVPPRDVFTNRATGHRFTIEQGPTRKFLRMDARQA
jgi:hypothetical protein